MEVEAFSQGSIIVDYYVVFKDLERKVTTQDLKDTVDRETKMPDNKNMLGSTNLRIDPKWSDFIGNGIYKFFLAISKLNSLVVSTQEPKTAPSQQNEDFLPPWAVAVIVIGLASVAFVIVFGVSMVSSSLSS